MFDDIDNLHVNFAIVGMRLDFTGALVGKKLSSFIISASASIMKLTQAYEGKD